MNRGFSLIEVIVAASIFAVTIGAASALFVSALQGQRSAIAQQNVLDNVRFATEAVARQIRMAQRDSTGACTGEAESTFGGGGETLSFVAYDGDCTTYRLNSGKIQARKGGGQFEDITSDDININILDFYLQGQAIDDNEQPRATIFIKAEDTSQSGIDVELQTTVSGRNLDVP